MSSAFVLAGLAVASGVGGCGGESSSAGDASADAGSERLYCGYDCGPLVTSIQIAPVSRGLVKEPSNVHAIAEAVPGDAVPLELLQILSTGQTELAASDWTSPTTVTIYDWKNPGRYAVLPPAFFVSTGYQTLGGVLFIVSPDDVKVSAVYGSSSTSATVSVVPAGAGDPVRGQQLFQGVLGCSSCHGETGGGSPPVDGGDWGKTAIGCDGGAVYRLPIDSGSTVDNSNLFPYPAPPLNNTTTDAGPNLAADPTWNAGLLGMASQSGMDNHGEALSLPMPVFLGAKTGAGTVFNGQDAADIYAWLKTQTH
jgi:hypothetical protein